MSEQVLELTNITKSFGAKLILDEVSFSVNRRDRVGLVGENGTGKTTLARIVMDTLQPDSGRKRLPADVEIGYLPQEAEADDTLTIQQFLEHSMGQLDQMRLTLAQLEEQISAPDLPSDQLSVLLDEYGQLQAEFTSRGGYDADYRLDQVFAGLQLDHIDRGRSIQTLSGGEKTRVALASLLLSAPSLLVLDEPTNHLDFAAVDWLEKYLFTYAGAVLVISHDRHFLNKVVTQIIELSPATHKLTVYPGNYDFYMATRERERQKQQQAYEEQQEEIKRLQRLLKAKAFSTGHGRPATDNDKMAYDHKGGNVEKSQSREIRAAKQRLEQIAENPITRPANRWRINPDFNPEELVSRDVIRLIDVSKAYGDRTLFRDVTETVSSGQRIVLQGPNGLGKTTLLKIIMGLEQTDRGEVRIARGARLGYLDQEQETLDLNQTVLEVYSRDLMGTEDEHRANLHKYGLFSENQVLQQIGSLSIGQRRKLQIARLIAQKANVLILDEPTNHLDLESVDQFERALCEFGGTVLATSHDRYFIERVATLIWTFCDGRLVRSEA